MTHPAIASGVRLCGALTILALFTGAVVSRPSDAAQHDNLLATVIDNVTIRVADSTVSPADSLFLFSVEVTNPVSMIAGFEVDLVLDRPDLVLLDDSAGVDTLIICSDSVTCDTSIDSTVFVRIELTGSAIADWDFVQARALSPGFLKVLALPSLGGGGGAPLETTDNAHLLLSFGVRRVATANVLDTLQDRTVRFHLLPLPNTTFTNTTFQSIGWRDTIFCANPPVCDTLDTVRVDDNVYLDGSLTFSPSCTLGDTDDDGIINASDIIFLVNYVFKSGAEPLCSLASADVDCASGVTASDIIYLVNYVFKTGPPPCVL